MFTSIYIKVQLALEKFAQDQRGVTAIEYAVIGVAVAAIVAAVFGVDNSPLKTALSNAVTTISGSITGAGTTTP